MCRTGWSEKAFLILLPRLEKDTSEFKQGDKRGWLIRKM